MAFFCGVIGWYEGMYFGMMVVLCVMFFSICYRWFDWSRKGIVYLFLLILFGFFCGYARSGWVTMRHQDAVQRVIRLGEVELEGKLTSDPKVAGSGQRITVNIDGLGDVEISVPVSMELWRGDSVRIRGKIIEDIRYETSYVKMQPGKILSVHEPTGFFGILASVRRYFVVRMQGLFPESVGAFMVGILAGGERGLSDEVKGDFRRTGLSHILAVSGYNVSLLLQLGVAVIPVRRKWRFAVFGFLLLVFIGLVGFQASAVRAAIMGFLGVWAAGLGRVKDMTLILLWSGFAMVLYDPSMLLFDKGFQLSFFATVGVIYVSPVVAKWFPERESGLIESFAGTLAVYIALLPVTMSFGKLPLIGLVTNLLFVWFIPIAMTIGAGVFVLSFLLYPLAFVLARGVSLFVSWYFFAIHFFSWLPFSVFDVPPMTKYVVVGYYVLLAWWVCRAG
ncbi:MAG: ComEC/Rec2 family competence protein [Candidatus Peregrinibacteria bacterium]|nr:ComEC/Rec2 family competence protein [Candidatus Peregrinibacteria bacterium]